MNKKISLMVVVLCFTGIVVASTEHHLNGDNPFNPMLNTSSPNAVSFTQIPSLVNGSSSAGSYSGHHEHSMEVNPDFANSAPEIFTPTPAINSRPNSAGPATASDELAPDESGNYAQHKRRGGISPDDTTIFNIVTAEKLLAITAATITTANLYANFNPIKKDNQSFMNYCYAQLKQVVLHPQESFYNPKLRTLTCIIWGFLAAEAALLTHHLNTSK